MQVIKNLVEYYDRAVKSGVDMAREGWAMQNLDFVIIIDQDGKYLRTQDVRVKAAKGSKMESERVIMPAVKRSSNISPNFLYDNLIYVVGDSIHDKPEEFVYDRNISFIEKVQEYKDHPDIAPVYNFYAECNTGLDLLYDDTDLWDTIRSEFKLQDPNLTFAIEYAPGVISSYLPLIHRVSALVKGLPSVKGTCSITGQKNVDVAINHPPIKKIGQSSGSFLISYNNSCCDTGGQVNTEYTSKYAAALNYLLDSKKNTISISDDTKIVFWQESSEEDIEWIELFGAEESDNSEMILAKIKSVRTGVEQGKVDGNIHFLTIRGNSARICVLDYRIVPFTEFFTNIDNWFKAFADCKKHALSTIKAAASVRQKISECPHGLAEELINMGLFGTKLSPHYVNHLVKRYIMPSENTWHRQYIAALLKLQLT